MEAFIKERIENWLEGSYDESSKKEIRELLEAGEEKELTDRFYKDLEFGTGGLRGIVGAGTNRMNTYNVRLVTQGLANHLRGRADRKGKPLVIVTFDCRKYSDVFAAEAARVLAANQIQCYLTESLRPTPFLSYCVRQMEADAGIVITASHNPPQYNGYKVYGADGAQVISPEDKQIIQRVRDIAGQDEVKTKPFNEAKQQGLIKYIPTILDENYIRECAETVLAPELFSSGNVDLKLVYTPLHGTGITLVPALFQKLNMKNYFIVSEQEKPDGAFPTVRSPNPEEPEALSMALELGRKEKAELILATDPDGDRVGIAFPDKSGDFILPTGNQIAVLVCYYKLSKLAAKGKDLSRGYITKTIVTTRLLDRIAEYYGVKSFNVLTGFKWIARTMRENEGTLNFIFGGEESYGYLNGDYCRDKDAVGMCGVLAELALYLRQQNQTFDEYLDRIYERFGFFLEEQQSIKLEGQQGEKAIQKLLAEIRKAPPSSLGGSQLESVMDVKQGAVFDAHGEKVIKKLNLPTSPVIGLDYKDDTQVILRPSGTEPKIKFYFGVRKDVPPHQLQQTKIDGREKMKEIQSEFMDMIRKIIKEP